MTLNSNAFLVYAPTMHREFLAGDLPAGIRTVWPGLPDSPRSRRDPAQWLTPDLPFTPSQAASCAAGLERLDENGIASFSAATPEMQASARRELQEQEDLARFARSGEVAAAEGASATAGKGAVELRRWAQHYLLLGWIQEERVLDMDRLVERYRAGAQKLASHIGGTEEEEGSIHAELLSAMNDLVPESPEAFLPSWRLMLELLSILLPAEALLCTADRRMIEGLADLPHTPFSSETLLRGTEAACVQGPVWKLLGRKEPDAERPWLDAGRRVILLGRDHIHE